MVYVGICVTIIAFSSGESVQPGADDQDLRAIFEVWKSQIEEQLREGRNIVYAEHQALTRSIPERPKFFIEALNVRYYHFVLFMLEDSELGARVSDVSPRYKHLPYSERRKVWHQILNERAAEIRSEKREK